MHEERGGALAFIQTSIHPSIPPSRLRLLAAVNFLFPSRQAHASIAAAMKTLLASTLALFCVTLPAFSQRAAPLISPDIKDDHSVTFSIRAPKSQSVAMRGQWDRQQVEMTKGEENVWSVNVPSIPAGVWEYSFVVDGLTLIDPANPAQKPQRNPSASILHLPGTPPNVWDFQDVPHGTVHQHTYLSKALGRQRGAWVYTPPGYEAESFHGISAPKGTPREIVVKLNREINAALADPKLKAQLAELGAQVFTGTPEDYGRYLRGEIERWKKVIEFSGAKAEK